MALVLPAELLQVSYTAQLRSFLTDRFGRIDLIACSKRSSTRLSRKCCCYELMKRGRPRRKPIPVRSGLQRLILSQML